MSAHSFLVVTSSVIKTTGIPAAASRSRAPVGPGRTPFGETTMAKSGFHATMLLTTRSMSSGWSFVPLVAMKVCMSSRSALSSRRSSAITPLAMLPSLATPTLTTMYAPLFRYNRLLFARADINVLKFDSNSGIRPFFAVFWKGPSSLGQGGQAAFCSPGSTMLTKSV